MEVVERIITILTASKIIELVIIAVVMDTVFGVARAIKQRAFNSSVGIDGAIRKIAMLVSLAFLAIIDKLIHINLIGFIPEEIRNYLPQSISTIGMAEFFGLLYLGYEIVSILKNMALCGLPVKKLWKTVHNFLGKYTEELPDTEDQDLQPEQAAVVVEATDDV